MNIPKYYYFLFADPHKHLLLKSSALIKKYLYLAEFGKTAAMEWKHPQPKFKALSLSTDKLWINYDT